MWLSERMAKEQTQETAPCGGVVSLGGDDPAVVTHGEERNMAVFSPGGYCWRPEKDDAVAVLPGERAIVGKAQGQMPLQPGEVRLFSKKAAIYLANDGSIRLEGDVYINGERWVPHVGGTD